MKHYKLFAILAVVALISINTLLQTLLVVFVLKQTGALESSQTFHFNFTEALTDDTLDKLGVDPLGMPRSLHQHQAPQQSMPRHRMPLKRTPKFEKDSDTEKLFESETNLPPSSLLRKFII